jgi:hypothetical protein
VLGRWHDWNTVLLVSAGVTLVSAVVWLGANPQERRLDSTLHAEA